MSMDFAKRCIRGTSDEIGRGVYYIESLLRFMDQHIRSSVAINEDSTAYKKLSIFCEDELKRINAVVADAEIALTQLYIAHEPEFMKDNEYDYLLDKLIADNIDNEYSDADNTNLNRLNKINKDLDNLIDFSNRLKPLIPDRDNGEYNCINFNTVGSLFHIFLSMQGYIARLIIVSDRICEIDGK